MKAKQLNLIPRSFAEWIAAGKATPFKIGRWIVRNKSAIISKKKVDQTNQLNFSLA